jgi:hypothetical protein
LQAKLPDIHFLIPASLPAYREKIEAAVNSAGISAKITDGRSLEVMAAAELAITKSDQEMRSLLGEVGVCDRAAIEILQFTCDRAGF